MAKKAGYFPLYFLIWKALFLFSLLVPLDAFAQATGPDLVAFAITANLSGANVLISNTVQNAGNQSVDGSITPILVNFYLST
ncbi:MAG TPA: hypothetical protein VFG95_08110, partial [Nitrospiria bacterium]|nr:hypothetical protein [Nitrospiria bacterium]